MKPLVCALRVLCLALLLPQLVLAPAFADVAFATHECCPESAEEAAHPLHHGDSSSETAPPSAPSHAHHALDCGLHSCSWVAGSGDALIGPLTLGRLRYSHGSAAPPPLARAESLHRPPNRLS